MKFLRGLALSIAFTLLTPSSYAQAPNQFNSDGALAFNPNGTPLAGFNADGSMEGAACWRADGTAIGLGGGLARQGVRFWPDRTRA